MTEPITVYLETCAAIDRFLAGAYNPTQLRSWLMIHFDAERADQQAEWLWTGVMTLLAVYGAGDFERSDLNASIRQLRHAEDPFTEVIRTPWVRQKAFRDIMFSPTPPWPIRAGIHRDDINARARREGLTEL